MSERGGPLSPFMASLRGLSHQAREHTQVGMGRLFLRGVFDGDGVGEHIRAEGMENRRVVGFRAFYVEVGDHEAGGLCAVERDADLAVTHAQNPPLQADTTHERLASFPR